MFTIDNMSSIPVYEQIVRQVEGLLLSGQLKPGDPLPSVRGLATDLGVNPNTIQKAYAEKKVEKKKKRLKNTTYYDIRIQSKNLLKACYTLLVMYM